MFIRFYVISLHAPRGTREKMEIVTKARIDIRQEELQLRGVGFRCCETDNAVVENCVILEKSCCHSTADKTAANEHMGPLIQATIPCSMQIVMREPANPLGVDAERMDRSSRD